MRRKKLIVVIGVAIVFVLSLWIARRAKIDACLDRGGRWVYEHNRCDL
jgi:hypothetical protein